MLAERVTKTEVIIKLLSDGKPRTVAELSDELGLRNLDSLLSNMWRRGHVLASEKMSIYKPLKENGSWRWSRSKQRWYTVADEPRVIKQVAYETWDKRHGKVVKRTENLVFTIHEEANDTSTRESIGARILDTLEESNIALFVGEIAGEVNAGKGRIASALNYLLKKGKVKKAGWFNPLTGKEAVFDKGYLYFLTNERYKQRLAKRNVLSGVKQAVYERIRLNTETQHRFTPHRELFSPRSKDATLIIRELQSVYQDLAKEEINGEPYYYIAGILGEKELEKERNYWQGIDSRKRSRSNLIGHAHEIFCHVALDRMWESKDLKIEEMWWEFSITRDGKKRYTVYKNRASDPAKLVEMDRVLHMKLAPFTNGRYVREIVLVFEMKYVRQPRREHWDDFVAKLADTFDFGPKASLPAIGGGRVVVRAPKFNVVPVMIATWKGKDEIEVGGKMVNFAQYVQMQGGIVIYTGELERYLNAILGRKVSFQKVFREWYSDPERHGEFTSYLTEFALRH